MHRTKTFIISSFRKKAARLVLFLIFVSSRVALSQDYPSKEYQAKAVFLFNFSRFIDWPPTFNCGLESPFVIGIVGTDPFGNYLGEAVAGEKVMDHPVILRRYKTAEEIADCQIIFVNFKEAIQVKKNVIAYQ